MSDSATHVEKATIWSGLNSKKSISDSQLDTLYDEMCHSNDEEMLTLPLATEMILADEPNSVFRLKPVQEQVELLGLKDLSCLDDQRGSEE